MSLTELLLLLGREACRLLDEELEERGIGDPSARVVLALLTAAYGTMFVLIKMQQYNLLAGSCLLFAALFAVMYYTREIDWYALSDEKSDNHTNVIEERMAARQNHDMQ